MPNQQQQVQRIDNHDDYKYYNVSAHIYQYVSMNRFVPTF